MSKLTTLTESLRLQAEIVERFSALNEKSPEKAASLIGELSAGMGLARRNGSNTPRANTFARLARHFLRRSNQWLTKAEMVEQTGIKSGTIHSIVYTTNAEDFEKSRKGRERTFRLTTESLRIARIEYEREESHEER